MDGRTVLDLVRPFTLLAPAVGSLAGAVAATAATGASLDPLRVGLGVLAALAATGASNAWNQAFDAQIDAVNKPERPVPSGRASVAAALRLGHALAVVALTLAFLASLAFGACVAIGIVATWVYSAPPWRTKASLVGALLTIAIPRGYLVPVAGWSLVISPFDASDPWALGAIAFLFVLGAAGTKDFADVEGDRAHGCRTLPVVLGLRPAARLMAPFLVLPFLLFPLGAWLGWLHAPLLAWVVLALVLVALGLVAAISLLRDPDALARGGTAHPAWRAMYLLLLAIHVGSAIVYML
ncbi:MAG: UbiA family prenyltransferase [Planctomycetota bacterium]